MQAVAEPTEVAPFDGPDVQEHVYSKEELAATARDFMEFLDANPECVFCCGFL